MFETLLGHEAYWIVRGPFVISEPYKIVIRRKGGTVYSTWSFLEEEQKTM